MKAGPKVPIVKRCGANAEMRDKQGRLIFKVRTRGKQFPSAFRRLFKPIQKWDAWRIHYCATHRGQKLMWGFREGRIDPFTILSSLIYHYKRG